MADPLRHLPILGPHIAKLGHVMDMVYSECSPDASLWIQAAFQAAPSLGWALTKPELIEIDLIRGKRRHARHRRFRLTMTQLIQPTIEIRGLPGWARFTFNTVERVGWYLLVLDATTDFVVNWTSMTYRWAGCQVPNQPYAIGKNGFIVSINGQVDQMVLPDIVDNNRGIEITSAGITVHSGITASFQIGLKQHSAADSDPTVRPNVIETWMTRQGTGEVFRHRATRTDGQEHLGSGGVVKDPWWGGSAGFYQLFWRTEGDYFSSHLTLDEFSSFGQRTRGLQPDP